MPIQPITDAEFAQFQRFIFDAAGITMSASKRALISGRLAKRLTHFQLTSYGEYFRLLSNPRQAAEAQTAVDLLTTNETYFFRESKHFDLLRTLALEARARRAPLRVWSAASSTGEEAYGIAMILAELQPDLPWEVVGSDISLRVLEQARKGLYASERTTQMPHAYLHKYCLKGIDEQAGTVLVQRSLRQRVQFIQVNLTQPVPSQLGPFDIIFLRNVLIYFNNQTKREVVANVLQRLKPGGHFFIGHSESLNDVSDGLQSLAPATYRKP
jgi:chemotaxis protein methyltransferase CheR